MSPIRLSWLGSRAALLISLIALSLMGVWLYVGSAWAVALYRLIFDGGTLLLWLASVLGTGAFVQWSARWRESDAPNLLRWVTAAALGLGFSSLAVLGLGLAGLLTGVTAWGLLIVGCGLGAIVLKRNGGLRRPAVRDWFVQPAGWDWLWLMAAPFLALVITAAMTPPGTLWTPNEPHGYDVVEYHLQIPREWYEARRIIPLRHNVFSFFPFNVEAHYLLAMHLRGGAWAGMYLAQLMHASLMALSVLAVYGLARFVARPAPAALAGVAMLSVPWITQMAPIAYDEGGFLLFGTLAVGWTLRATFVAQYRLRDFALGGALAGFAAGSKLTAVPEVLVALPILASLGGVWMYVSTRERPTGSSMAAGIGLFVALGALTFSPWLLRNAVWAGNPVFPELMPLLGRAHFSPVQQERWHRAHTPPPSQRSATARLTAFYKEIIVGWQFGYLLIPLGILGLACSMRRPDSWFLAGLLLILCVFWLALTHLQGRFFILAVPVAALLVARVESRWFTTAGIVLVGFFASVAWWGANEGLRALLYGSADLHRPGIIFPPGSGFQPLGTEDLRWLTPEAADFDKLPPQATLVLAGDARAFVYQLPMSRLLYRTVFDVNSGPDAIIGWAGRPLQAEDWVLIDPAELRRFEKTYWGLPPLPAAVRGAAQPYLSQAPAAR